MIRWPRLEWFVEKATELGVQRISLIRLSYSRFTKKNDNFINKINRLIKISSEAQKQCARPMAPKIDVPQPLDEWLRSLADTHDQNMQKIVFDETIASSPLSENFFQKRNSYLMLVGTEGGFTPEEVQSAERSGFERVSLGKTKFRAETAALYGACALDFYLKGKAAL
jgi:16S rRNA (uracil1498-N3)-methyltransferase